MLKSSQIDSTWTLFLDRDGVINKHGPGYVRTWSEFEFVPGALEAIPKFMAHFGRIVIVTNQQGIGKGLMSREDLSAIFRQLQQAVIRVGGKIDCFYYCPHLAATGCGCRKPATGMGLQAQMDFPDIAFSKSVMVGDQLTDMQFGKALGMKTVFVQRGREIEPTYAPFIDEWVESLAEFARLLDIG